MTTKERIFASIAVLLGVLASLAGLEIVMRFLPVQTGVRLAPVTAQAPVAHLQPNEPYTFSTGWNLRNVNRGRINNAGFVNDQDYQPQGAKPLLAVVGDSFIEARMVPYPQTLQGRLAKALDGEFRVYSFAASGAPMSQYLIWAQYAVREYGARAVIINIVLNDFDESYIAYRTSPVYWVYVADADGQLRLRFFEYRQSALRSILSKSALARYVAINLKLEYFLQTMASWRSAAPRQAAATPARATGDAHDADARRLNISYAVIEAFFRDVHAMIDLPPDRILFLVDGYHYPNAAAVNAGGYFDRMRRAFIAKAAALGYGVIDLDPQFFARYRQRADRFEVPDDGHWNAFGHEVAADAALSSDFMRRLRDGRDGAAAEVQ
ncbi:MAG TPA: hypothetical protein VEK73_08985 [Xanthobacteraceae bacterium]|nr:hypothetical protein [Xanthobacteraceae bacterium]